MGHIFISYSHKDSAYVENLKEKLEKEGFKVWIDHRIDFGTVWPQVIQDNLDASDALILVMSQKSYESIWVQNELDRARQNEIPIFPLLLSGKAQWLSVQTLHYVDVRDKSLPPERFYQRLEKVTPRNKQKSNEEPETPPNILVRIRRKLSKVRKPITIVTSLLILVMALLATVYFAMPTMPETPPFARSTELTDLFITNNTNVKFDKTVFSRDDDIYLSLFLTKYQAVGNYESNWYYLITIFGKDKKILLSTQRDNKSTVSDSIVYGLTPPLFPGYYRVDVSKNGDLIGLKYFWIK